MPIKTQNLYNVTVSSIEKNGGKYEFSVEFEEKGYFTSKKTRKNSNLGPVLEQVAASGKSVDLIVDGRGSVIDVRVHDFDFDLSAHSSVDYEVWAFSSTGAQVRHYAKLTYADAKKFRDNAEASPLPQYLQFMGWDTQFRVVRATASYEVVDN